MSSDRARVLLAAAALLLAAAALIALIFPPTNTGRDSFTAIDSSSLITPSPTTEASENLKIQQRYKEEEEGGPGPPEDTVQYTLLMKNLYPPAHGSDFSSEPLREGAHSGHYREQEATLWDPHPEYEFTVFNRTFHLRLQLARTFFRPKLMVTHVWRNMTVQKESGINTGGCFYTGVVKGDPGSSVSVNLCHGMTGHIGTSEGSYLIEPAEPYQHHATPIRHAVSRHSLPNPGSCNDEHHHNVTEKKMPSVVDHMRRRRSLSQEHFIEIMVVADQNMREFHGNALKNYILTIMGMVSQIFKDASIGNPISVAVVKLYVLEEDDTIPRRNSGEHGVQPSKLLKAFCDWQYQRNDRRDENHNHHDTAILITREILCQDPKINETCNTLGLAELGTMCDHYFSCSIVRDNGLSAAFTIAHELGHVLNMPHDEDARCLTSGGDATNMHKIMSRVLDNTKTWYWSRCSRHFLTEFLDAGYGSCLSDEPEWDLVEEQERKNQLPGEVYHAKEQCELVYGPGYRTCSYQPVCQRLWCTRDTGENCKTLHMPWADGTPCGDFPKNRAWWCHKGECVPRDPKALLPVNGGWGPWKPYGECSRTCGGGVKQATRDCNNPRPTNGGRYCVGKRVRYKSCAIWDCTPGSPDFREAQCSSFNNDSTIKIQGFAEVKSWVPKYGGISLEERCKLYCGIAGTIQYYLLKDKVIDGTVCGPDTYDICVNGVCVPAGCDHILNSTTQLDSCGECGGNNSSCQVVTGKYDESRYGYSTVVRIPEGSSYLDIRQTGHMGSNKDDNYLSLVDSETGDFILNGNFSVSVFRRLIIYGKTTLEYSGSDAAVERVNSSRPLSKDLIVMVLSAGKLYPPNIMYQYSVQKSSLARYEWEMLGQWSPCDKVCNGETRRDIVCVRTQGREQVASEMCRGLHKPHSPSAPCNKHCILKWEVTSLTECSSHCGPGVRVLAAQCVQAILSPARRVPIDNGSCSHLPRPPLTEACLGPCDDARWNFTQWGPCSKTCGEGIQTRQAFCVDELNRARNETECRVEEKKVERVCSLQKCPEWGYGQWTPCSVTCGRGERRRPYWCHEDNIVVSTTHCSNMPVPDKLTVEPCSLDPCPSWVTHPWSSCSVTCGVGEQSRLVECSAKETECSSATKPPTVKSCTLSSCVLTIQNPLPDIDNSASKFSWKPKPWGSCSVTCGEGVRWREADCYDEKFRRPADPLECLSQLQPINKMEKCIMADCPTWIPGSWGPCSAICDQGIRTREVKCAGPRGVEVDERYCEHNARPAVEEVCRAALPCRGPVSSWKTSAWSQCSVTCGGGYRFRKVTCDGAWCPEPRPPASQPCNSNPCTAGTWQHGNWSQCSTTCGRGTRLRLVRCRSTHGTDLPQEACAGQPKPAAAQPCHLRHCSNFVLYNWQHSRHWSQCSVTCGRGTQTRVVHCYGYRGLAHGAPSVVDPSYCSNSMRPASVQACTLQPCGSARPYHWVPGPWLQCNEKCSRRGRQIRKLFCYSGNAKVRKINCHKIKRPERRKKCQMDRCTSCTELQKASGARRDGEYLLEISKRRLSIFCYHMATAHPREYLTLHSTRDNYAEVYDKRLMDVDTCPMNGQRDDNCDCVVNTRSNVGFTVFTKIRLNITTLIVDGRDWTFANAVRGNRVGYGEAGDCYSRADCPQGRFSINLERTGFHVVMSQMWHKYGSHVSHDILKYQDNIKIMGICGGFCGMCRPHGGLRLEVLPP